jgi:hypothetical protein
MSPHIDVKFERVPHDPSVEASVQRWVDRIGWTNVEVERASVTIERSGWRRTAVSLALSLLDGRSLTTSITHADVYVAVADVFREARKQLLGEAAARGDRSVALTG